jgi:general secretion pathway protein K
VIKSIAAPLKIINNNQRTKNAGIALIQVLLITAILSVLALYLSKTARDQVTVARWLDDKASAQIAIHSAEAQILFSLFTEPFLAESSVSSDETIEQDAEVDREQPLALKNIWNFFGHPFAINNQVTIRMQDQAGLINAHYLISKIIRTLIESQEYSEIEANVMIDHLLDWQDIDSIARINGNEDQGFDKNIRNGAMSSIYDLVHISGIPPSILPLLYQNVTIYHRGNFNPMNASVELLAALSNQDIAEQVNELRINRQLNRKNFKELTDIKEDDDIFMFPSNYLAITIVGQVGEVQARKAMIISIQPNASNNLAPLNTYSITN